MPILGDKSLPGSIDKPSGLPHLFRWFKPAPHQPLRSEEEIKRQYPLYRWRIFEAAFVAYAAFYIVRNNFAPVSKEIGAALNISPRTVETHRASLMRKLDLHSVAELTRFALEKGLVRKP